MRNLLLAVLVAVSLGGCVSQFAKSYVGKTQEDLELDLGRPYNIVQLNNGRRSLQYFWGGGQFVSPQTSTSKIVTDRNQATITSETYPATVHTSQGCLVNFIVEQQNGQWIVTEARWPKRMVC